MQDEPYGLIGLTVVCGLVIGTIWAIGKIIDVAVDIYVRCQRDRGE